jgi:hypothetical protein
MSARAHQDMGSTIRHLRRKRRSIVQRRRRQRRLLAAAGALAFALATASGVASYTDTDLAGAAAAKAQSLVDLIKQRSPGPRTAAQLTKTKSVRRLAERLPSSEVGKVPANLAEVIVPPIPDLVPVDLGPPPQLAFLEMPTLPGSILVPPSSGPKVPPGGGGCCAGPPSSPPIVPPHTPPPPVLPEPGTWMTMLFGFGFIGWAMRRGRAPALKRA